MSDRHGFFVADVSSMQGLLVVAVFSVEGDASSDVKAAAFSFTGNPFGMLRVKNLRKSSKRITEGMQPIRSCVSRGETWAWVKRADR